jgi:GDP-L-fucose synthase
MTTLDLSNKKILVTGGAGFLGQQVVNQLIESGASPDKITIPRSKDYDLCVMANCQEVVKNQDIIIHLAAHVGGIGLNQQKPAELFYDNLMMGTQLIHAAYLAQIEKFVCVGTICAYPKFTPVPFKEEDIWNGYPEETNAPYGVAKKALLVQLQAYRQQYGFNGIYVLPVNLYGPADNFDPSSSHVIPALIRKVHEAQQRQDATLPVWGDGSPSREFIYAADAAKGIVLATTTQWPTPALFGYPKSPGVFWFPGDDDFARWTQKYDRLVSYKLLRFFAEIFHHGLSDGLCPIFG